MEKKILIITNPNKFNTPKFFVPDDCTLRLLEGYSIINLNKDGKSFINCEDFEQANLYIIKDDISNEELERFGFSNIILLYHQNGMDIWCHLDYADFIRNLSIDVNNSNPICGWHGGGGIYPNVYNILTDNEDEKYERVLAYLNTIIE